MANEIGTLGVVLSANIDQFKSALKEAENTTKTFGNNMTTAFANARGAVTGFIAAYAGINAVQGVMSKLGETGDLVDLAAGLSVSVEALQKFEYAGVGAGVSAETLHSLFQRLSKASAEFADGNEDVVASFKKLGIASVDLNAPDETLLKIVDSLNNVTNASDKMSLAIQLGGKSGAQALLRLAAEGRENLVAAMEEAAAKGLIIGTKTAEGADNAGDAIAKLAWEFNQKLHISVTENAEEIQKLGEAFFKVLPAVLTAVEQVASGFVWLGKTIGEAAAKFQGFESGEDALTRTKKELAEVVRMEKEHQGALDKTSGVYLTRLAQIQAEKARLEKQVKDLSTFEPKPAAKTTDKPVDKPTANRGAGAPKTTKEKTSATIETAETQIQKDVASLLGKTDSMRLVALANQTEELKKQKAIWESMDTSLMSDEMKNTRIASLKTYEEALIDVSEQTQKIYEEQDKAITEQNKAWNDWANSQRDMANSIRESLDPTIKLANEIEKIKQLTADGFLPTEEAEKYIKTLQDRTKETTDYAKDLGMTFQSAFQDAIIEGKGFNAVLSGIIKDIASMILKMGVINPMMEGLFGTKATGTTAATKGILSGVGSSISDWFTGLFKAANGGIVGDGVPRYADGGVVGMSPSGMFIAGEAGPEGILPLKRINGKLGVTAEGMGGTGTTIVNHVTVQIDNANDPKAAGKEVSEAVVRALADQQIAKASRVGGMLNPIGGR